MNDSLGIWLPTVRAGSGSDVFVERLAQALQRAGHRPCVEWFDHRYELMPWRLLGKKAPAGTDVVHANSWQGFAFKRPGIPLVVTEHHYVLDPAFRPYKSLAQHLYHRTLIGACMRRSFRAADAIVAVSTFTAKALVRAASIKATRVIPQWLDYEEFSPGDIHPVEGENAGVFRLLFVGNTSKRKGIDIIPPLARRLGNGFQIRCTSGLRAGAWNHAGGNITVLGRLAKAQLVNEYRHCDAVLVPSRYEGFGYAALEAMACAKPVVGFLCGAVDEVVVNGETALMAAIDDIATLEEHCRRLAHNRALAVAMGTKGRQRAVSVFTQAKAIEAYVELYRQVLTPHHSNPSPAKGVGEQV